MMNREQTVWVQCFHRRSHCERKLMKIALLIQNFCQITPALDTKNWFLLLLLLFEIKLVKIWIENLNEIGQVSFRKAFIRLVIHFMGEMMYHYGQLFFYHT